MKRKVLLSPLIIVILIIIFGATAVGAAIYFGGGGGTEEVNLQKGLVGNWKFDGNAKDSTPYGNNGTVTGAVLTTDRKGTANKAYSFSGVDQYVNAGNPASLNLTTAISVSVWVNPNATNIDTYGRYVDKWTSWHLGMQEADETNIRWEFTGFGTTVLNSGAGTVTPGAWNHIVGTYDKNGGTNNRKIYINGVLIASRTDTETIATVSENVTMGTLGSSISQDYKGLMDEVRIYNRALSQTEITALYQEYDPGIQVSDLQKGLVGNWKMDGNIKDSTPYSSNNLLSATGGTITTSGGYTIHTFTSGGAFTPNMSGNVEVLVVAGGGGGGGHAVNDKGGGGGGAGGLIYNASLAVTAQAYDVTVGGGGGGGGTDGAVGTNGDNSVFSTLTAVGGGGGGPGQGGSGTPSHDGVAGGSGGGATGNGVGGAGTSGQGYKGGDAGDPASAGGGGASAAAANGVVGTASAGGAGLSYSISGSSVPYAGGGGGGAYSGTAGGGGNGGGGAGGGVNADGVAGTDNTGGGGGGAGGGANAARAGKAGGSGIVIVRYLTPTTTATAVTLTADRKGQALKAYSFNGSSSTISLGNETFWDTPLNGANPFTVSFWYKADLATDIATIWGKGLDDTNGWVGMYIGTEYGATSGTDIQFAIVGAGGTGAVSISLLNVQQQNIWQHWTIAYDGSKTVAGLRIYRNGILQSMTTRGDNLTGTVVNNENLKISGALYSAWALSGMVDEFRIYNRALSPTEVTALYEEYDPGIQVSDLQKGLVGNWKMDGDAKDSTPYSNNGTVTGATLVNDRKGQALKAYSFDGGDDVIYAPISSIFQFTTAFTISFWVKPDSPAPAQHQWAVEIHNAAYTQRLGIAAKRSGNAIGSYNSNYDGVGGAAWVMANSAPTLGVWNHIVGVFNPSGALNWYLNGVADGTPSAGAFPVWTAGNISVDIGSLGGGSTLQGLLDDVRIYNRALSQAEITALYESY